MPLMFGRIGDKRKRYLKSRREHPRREYLRQLLIYILNSSLVVVGQGNSFFFLYTPNYLSSFLPLREDYRYFIITNRCDYIQPFYRKLFLLLLLLLLFLSLL